MYLTKQHTAIQVTSIVFKYPDGLSLSLGGYAAKFAAQMSPLHWTGHGVSELIRRVETNFYTILFMINLRFNLFRVKFQLIS